jgi:hypothetical protein
MIGKPHHQYVRPATPVARDADQVGDVVAAAGTAAVVPAIDQAAVLCFRNRRVRLTGCWVGTGLADPAVDEI